MRRKSARKARRRALIVSIIVQILVLAALVMYPLLSHGERLAVTTVTPYDSLLVSWRARTPDG